VVINDSSGILFYQEIAIIIMAGGIWVLLVIPAIIAFVFGAWVLYSIMIDVSERETSPFTIVGPDRVRIIVEPDE
jgi:hypothetical protein